MFAPRRTSVPRRGLPLLVGLAVGGLLIGATAVATPDGGDATAVSAALGAPLTLPVPAAAPARAVPPPGSTAPRATVPPPVAAPPTALALAAPPPVTTAPRTTAPAPEPAPERTTEPPVTREPAPRRAAPTSGGATADVVSATNAERRAAGCDDLDVDLRLAAAAQGHADDMAANDYFSHTGRDGREFDDRISAEGHPAPAGENIAAGQSTAAAVVQAWMDSPGHRRNILDCDFRSIGVGYAPAGNYWVQNFGR